MKQAQRPKTRLHKPDRNQSGQAVVEYILLVAVSVSIIIGLKNAFKGAGDFVDRYVGAYTQCLMEYGELPSLGLDDAELTKHKNDAEEGCNPKFKNFTFAEGRPPATSTSGGSQSKSSSSANDKSQKSNSENRQAGKAADGANSSSSGSAGSSGSGKNASPYANGNLRRNGSGTVADGARASKVKEIEEQAEGDRPDRRSSGAETRTVYRVREKYRALTGKMADDFEKNANKTAKREPGRQSTIKPSEDGYQPGPRVSYPKQPERKVAAVEEEKDSGWGLGALVKWIMIIGIIIAIVIFFGGQIMNYSNSDS